MAWQLTEADILHEDNHLLVVNKPVGLATMGASTSEVTVARAAADFLIAKYDKPGKAFVGVVSRLDSMVSGVLVLAKTSKAASRLSDQIRRRLPTKEYLAWVDGDARTVAGIGEPPHSVEDLLMKNEQKMRMEVVTAGPQSKTQLAQLELETLVVRDRRSLVRVRLITGRKHQIRVQLAHLGLSIVGDRKYGNTSKFGGKGEQGIALHCRLTKIQHPTLKKEMTFVASPPKSWGRFGPLAAP
ncbi:MAG TPA: RluA family pseudouridine synthase [Planctomycetaceae bacterium]|nr:RluA family pseudouridine synthase [Planctomycetaceae bacterium]